MTRVAAGFDDGDVHTPALHEVDGVIREQRADALPLTFGVDGNHVDDAHPSVKRVEGDRDEADRPPVAHGDEYIALLACAGRPDRVGLTAFPVGMQPQEDRVAENVPNRVENGLPRSQRERDDGLEVVLLDERANIDVSVGHGSTAGVAVVYRLTALIVE